MLNKDITQGGWWEKIKGFARAHIGLTVIIVAALLLQLTTAVMYYTAENIIQHTMEQLVEREMNAVYMSIRNKLARRRRPGRPRQLVCANASAGQQ